MNKICTDIEQSKKLIELGVDANTADMCHRYRWSNNSFINLPCAEKAREPITGDIPAWSLSALLELIPPYLGEFGEGIDFGFGKAMNGKWYSAHYLQYFQNGDVDSVKTVTGDTAVDAAFEMVVWLKENGKI